MESSDPVELSKSLVAESSDLVEESKNPVTESSDPVKPSKNLVPESKYPVAVDKAMIFKELRLNGLNSPTFRHFKYTIRRTTALLPDVRRARYVPEGFSPPFHAIR